jgi:hypothetical protein
MNRRIKRLLIDYIDFVRFMMCDSRFLKKWINPPLCCQQHWHPCAEDEEIFESSPDAEDMEEAISKFMEGMEREECTGYNALHKLLQTLYPAQGTRGCLMGEFRQHVMSSP